MLITEFSSLFKTNPLVFTLFFLVAGFTVFVPLFLQLYRTVNFIVPSEVLSFPFTVCEEEELQQIQNKVKDFMGSLLENNQTNELTLSEYELNSLANKGQGFEAMAPKIKKYRHYTLENNSITLKYLTYPDPSLYKGYMIMIDSIKISIEDGELNGSLTRISQNDRKIFFGISEKWNGSRIFRDIFYTNGLDEIDKIVSKLESIQIEEKCIRFIPKRLAPQSLE
ncbi:hypothetical protein [Pseudanabaena sp. 'Roaring Creek']|uniref:hypothetical protein n=1 Tax=Pseudanabaena sp. 'Roaring Creek' TaxID=1681830 RepID=UPI0006D86282|nr:hypothetical protein [Pseudanabaena sp. 'Roaring Creek']